MPIFKVVWTRTATVTQISDMEIEADDLEKAHAEADRLYDEWAVDPWIDDDIEVLDIKTDITEFTEAEVAARAAGTALHQSMENEPSEDGDTDEDGVLDPEYCDICNTELEEGQIGLCDKCQDEDEEKWFINHYRCPRCHFTWTANRWTATCDDDCPKCGKRHVSPFKSEDAPDETA